MTHLSTSSEIEGSARSFPLPLPEDVYEEDQESPTSIGLARSVNGRGGGGLFVTGAGASSMGKMYAGSDAISISGDSDD